jgi:hypothetical protein
MRKTLILSLALLALTAGLPAQWILPNPVSAVQQQPNGVQLTMQSGAMRIEVETDSIIHVLYSPSSAFPKRTEYVVTKTAWPAPQWKMEPTSAEIVLVTARLKLTVTRRDGLIAYSDLSGKKLMTEGANVYQSAAL